MVQHRFLMGAIAAALTMPIPAAARPAETTDLTASLRLAVDRGEMLYLYDRVAWLGTDDFRDHHPKLTGQADGYVVTGDEKQTDLAFFDRSRSKAIYRATFELGKLTKSGPPDADRVALTLLEKRMIAAKDKAMAAFVEAKVGLCSKASPNVAAIPSASPDNAIIVYLMTPQTEPEGYPLGGHFSVEVGQDGSVSPVRRFTNSCIDMKQDQAPKGAKPAAFVITHLLDPTPTEIHVFTSLASNMPIYVGTKNKWLWAVEGSKVRTVGRTK